MPYPTDTSILLAVEAIQAASNKVKLTPQLETCLKQLRSIVELLEISKLRPAAFQRLAYLLRRHLLPLYKLFPILGLRFSVSVLATVNETRILSAIRSDDKGTKDSWEVVQTALLSGILDFLEANQSSENRVIVATLFYPTLRLIFFTRPSIYYQPRPDLMYVLFQLLSETVTSHPDNQAQLRNPEIFGGAQIGAILAHAKAFLVIEALLELFVKLLPSKSSKDGIETRRGFIREVFDASKVPCAASIVDILETTSTADWEDIFLQITDLLAGADVTFPQPFEISKFRVEGSKAYPLVRLYVDHQGFVGNIDEGDQIETFHALFTSAQKITVAASRWKACITILFSPPPSVGQVNITHQSDGDARVDFDIERKEMARFVNSLKIRGVNDIEQAGRKLSKAEETVELDHSTRKTVPVSTQDKVQVLARRWDTDNSQSHPGQTLPTSPLVPRKSPSIQAMSDYDSIFGTTDEELTDLSDADDTKASYRPSKSGVIKQMHSKAPILGESESESDIPSAPRLKSRNKKIVVSDDDSRSSSLRQNVHSSHRISSGPSIAVNSAGTVPVSRPSACSSAMAKEVISPMKFESLAVGELVEMDLGPSTTNSFHAKRKARNSVLPGLASTSIEEEVIKPTGRKRKVVGETDSETQRVPSKRLRTSPVAPKEVQPGSKPPPPIQKRYGKKGRTSSPTPVVDLDVNFDEPPAPSTDASSTKLIETRRNQVSAMRDKGGKATSRIKPEPRKLRDFKKVVVETKPTKAQKQPKAATKSVQLDLKGRSNNKPIVEDKETDDNNKPKPQRRSARVEKTSNNRPAVAQASPEPETKRDATPAIQIPESKPRIQAEDNVAEDAKAPQKKPRDAPWKDLDFKKSSAVPTDGAAVPSLVQTVSPVESSVIVDEFLPFNDPMPGVDTAVEEAYKQDVTEDYFMPLKTGSISSEMEAPKDDHFMIDLIRGSLKPPSQKAVNPPASRKMTRTTIVSDTPPAIEYQVPRPSPLMHGFPSKSGHPRVSFAPSASFRPYRVLHTSLDTDSSPTRQKYDSGSFYGDKFRHSKHQEKQGWDNEQDYGRQLPRKHAQDSMAQIVDTISEITQIVVQNTSRRFDKVSKDLRAGQMSILHQTAEELQEMYNESVHHFYDDFISLESAYAAHHRNINAGLENASKVDQEFSGLLAGTIQEHNRNSLSRKFPNTLFTSPLPPIVSKPKLVL